MRLLTNSMPKRNHRFPLQVMELPLQLSPCEQTTIQIRHKRVLTICAHIVHTSSHKVKRLSQGLAQNEIMLLQETSNLRARPRIRKQIAFGSRR